MTALTLTQLPVRPAGTHAERIARAVACPQSATDASAAVVRSWTRCLGEYGLDPELRPVPPVLSASELRERSQRFDALADCARLEMTTLYQQLADPDMAVMLTDAEGVVMHLVASDRFAREIAPEGLRVGAIWSEREAGTNGMGTCLAEGGAVAIRQHEHFFQRYAALTCSAAPIFDENGELAAVLDVTSRSPLLLQQHSPVLVGMSCRNIENRLFDARLRHAYPIRFHSQPELVYTAGEGKLAVDRDGVVLAANRSALLQLGCHSMQALRGKRIDELFMSTLDELVARSARQSFHPVPVYLAQASDRFFMVAQQPPQDCQPRVARPAARQAAPRESAAPAPGHALPAAGDPRMDAQIRLATRVIARNVPVLLHGETGTGKDVFANALHAASPAARGAFVAINCASLPESLIESELFGYRAGAFTGAQREGRRGKILQADGGTLFLDEIGDMPMALQARLLRVLEERRVTPLGSETATRVEFQLISASHRNLAELVHDGRFREDLFYRLSGVELRLPPLRERADRLALIHAILAEEAGPGEAPPTLAPDAEQALMRYDWPGNLRQLRYALRTAVALCDGARLTSRQLPPEVVQGAPRPARHGRGAASDGAEAGKAAQETLPPFNAIQLNERKTILDLLQIHRWNVSTVARTLRVSRNTLYRKMRLLCIEIAREAAASRPAAGD
ncbi:sigma-54-dependent Fis family transcriptional regulator [Cupriavidus basilensis]|uniref:Sigma-54-dependent Fis family transcriptional regulator n=1 Tax=Cupriavidus basilensis TaxID=68895 RepID=A0ABT6AZZ3_9BURK|nr:sigma-54-dependent Fis family transcriptional regulator [Cupriavidus basilensis]MDF3838204.1 sigma-54-dependent Fis family transcriptional regulator [Cupriavidus basilensis]